MADVEKKASDKLPHCPFCDNEVEAFPFCSACRVTIVYCSECGKPIPKGEQACPTCRPKSKK